MKKILNLTKRNIKLYFSDKGMFFTSLITPLILLVLYGTFLAKVYKDSMLSSIPEGLNIPGNIIDGLVGGELISSLLAVSCITVAFCSNLLMVQDKVSGANKDLLVTPTTKNQMSIAYFLASFVSTLIINTVALLLCIMYLGVTVEFPNISNILMIYLNVIILTLFGCSLSSIINCGLKSQGQISAVGTIVSSAYGFICGAYMPMSSFGKGLQNILLFLPGTYGTSMIRNTTMNPYFDKLAKYVPNDVLLELEKGLDCKLSFFGNDVSVSILYFIMITTIAILLIMYIILSKRINKIK